MCSHWTPMFAHIHPHIPVSIAVRHIGYKDTHRPEKTERLSFKQRCSFYRSQIPDLILGITRNPSCVDLRGLVEL